MQTHEDESHRKLFMQRLRERAEEMQQDRASEITTGKPGEEALAVWNHKGLQVTHMPDDEQGILRISIGGGEDTPIVLNYCVIRGGVGQCIALLEKAIEALRRAP